MPINRNQQIRLRIIDECLSHFTKWYSVDDLLKKVNHHLTQEMGVDPVSIRTIYTDLQRLADADMFNADIEKRTDSRKVYYRYRDKSFSIRNAPITPHQINELQQILQSLEQVSNFPFGQWLDSIRESSDLHVSLDYGAKSLISLEHNPDLKGMDLFSDIFRAVINKQVLSIDFKDFYKQKRTYVFHPHYLKQYNSRWFLIGRNEEEPDTVWNLALDRIESFSNLDREFIPSDIDFDDYFYDVIGVTHFNGFEKQKILLRFSEESLPYVLTKPLHPSQKQRNTDDGILIEIQVKINYELFSVLRSFGKNVEVVEPPAVRQAFAEELKAALNLYESDKG
ncbi:helix-turn-helix transcriptional regulator [Membranihabitans marinus]|uniref:helix-turn-helix transcriptional regulator n=1 Tax=Membranihabitans marinus TaxID=1227546 RepID=UPI001F174D1F|nr:WYL domain-containing protein [Membranihabitans marinus]